MSERPSVYVETSVVSYLTAELSRDIQILARQQITREWWERRSEFALFTSPFTVREALLGDAAMVARRTEILREIPLLEESEAAERLTRVLVDRGPLPRKAEADAAHIAVSAVNGMEYVVTWNLKHIANPAMQGRIGAHCRAWGFEPPVMCTPEYLLEILS